MVHTLAPDRVAVVMGGNRGLGLELVRRLAALDMRVVLTCRVAEDGRAAIERLGGLADRVAVRQVDVSDADSVAWLVTWVNRRLGRCDVLVNNADALFDDDAAAASVDLELVRRTLETNLFGPWRLVQGVLPLMRAAGYGRIVNVSSGSAADPRAAWASRVSMSAVNALTRVFADELAGDGILVNACCPEAGADQAGGSGPLDASTSADTAVWLATLPDDGPTGRLWRGRSPIDS
ncbi:SDR family NAD(P)-dependent oxidoreductase [Micromonospora profundi]|uniref:SDR family NAD(P)-dependent oxidoreductase n=1 Tax=Micromonospora profundi TaxID=1420889 RepID=UPI0036B95DE9